VALAKPKKRTHNHNFAVEDMGRSICAKDMI
jgi:hypothetical protein